MARTHINSSTNNLWSFLLDQQMEGGHTGNIWFVNSVTGTDATTAGRNPEAPFASLVYAISQATASQHDVIYLMPGHSETCTGAATINVNKAGLDIIGLGTGRARPTISYSTSTAASFDINSANTLLKNIVFDGTGQDATTALLNVKAANTWIQNCEFHLANSSNQAALGILTNNSADRMVIEDCHFHGSNNAGCTAAISLVGGTDIIIRRNVIQGAFTSTVGGIQQATTDTVNCIVNDNVIQNFTAGATKAMVFTASSTGQIFRNYMQILSGTAPITGAAMSWTGGNYYAAAVATAGTLI